MGLTDEVPAGKEFPNSTHRRTGLPIYSLYGPGPVRKPTPAMLKKIDCLVYDIQDTGARSYTFISTMGLCMEECGKAGVEFVVLDRPNPLGGKRVEAYSQPPLQVTRRSVENPLRLRYDRRRIGLHDQRRSAGSVIVPKFPSSR